MRQYTYGTFGCLRVRVQPHADCVTARHMRHAAGQHTLRTRGDDEAVIQKTNNSSACHGPSDWCAGSTASPAWLRLCSPVALLFCLRWCALLADCLVSCLHVGLNSALRCLDDTSMSTGYMHSSQDTQLGAKSRLLRACYRDATCVTLDTGCVTSLPPMQPLVRCRYQLSVDWLPAY
jgi:hypothetical protein